jgi:predicted ATPase
VEHRRLVEELLRLEPGLAARVAERTDGNPLFAVQLVGDWVERGVLVPTARGLALEAGEDGRIPDDIHGLWTTRVARVLERHGPDARRALELAAVLGNEVDAAEWRALAEEARVAIRNVRRDANKAADTEKGDGGLTEDDCDRCKEDVQELTKKYEGSVGDLAKTKEAEVMEQ